MRECRNPNCKNQLKLESEFYIRRNAKDGLDPWCKDCRRADNIKRNATGHSEPISTKLVRDALAERGIPVTIGRYVGMPWVDIAAYGYIPIEAKSAKARGDGRHNVYTFGFTHSQVKSEKRGFVVLIAVGETVRYFVVPAEHEVFDINGEKLVLAVDTVRKRSNRWSEIAKYENAFHLIKNQVVADIQDGGK
jgi:hypothetical protein